MTAESQETGKALPVEIETLRSMLRDLARERRIAVYDTLLPFGFEVLPEPENWDYHCTPLNAVTFGATGGDGIHLSVLTAGPGAGAVVMTVPPSDTPNVVLGDSFSDFLRLGYYACFGWLEVLAFDPRAGDREYQRSPPTGSVTALLRDRLRATFALEPIVGVTDHLAQLQERVLEFLVLPDPAEWNRRHGI